MKAVTVDVVTGFLGSGKTTLIKHVLENGLQGRRVAVVVNEIGDLERMARLGVDGLCGNYPDRIRVAIAARVEEGLRA